MYFERLKVPSDNNIQKKYAEMQVRIWHNLLDKSSAMMVLKGLFIYSVSSKVGTSFWGVKEKYKLY